MTTATTVQRPSTGTLAEVVDILLDKGLVIDAYVRVSLVGIELVTIDARIVLASVDTYLHFAEAVNRLDLREKSETAGVDDLLSGAGGMGSGMRGEIAADKASDALEDGADSVKDKAKSMFGMDDGNDQADESDDNC